MTPTTAQPVTYGHDASIARFSVSLYQRVVEVGIVKPEDKPLGPPYEACQIRLRHPISIFALPRCGGSL